MFAVSPPASVTESTSAVNGKVVVPLVAFALTVRLTLFNDVKSVVAVAVPVLEPKEKVLSTPYVPPFRVMVAVIVVGVEDSVTDDGLNVRVCVVGGVTTGAGSLMVMVADLAEPRLTSTPVLSNS